MCRNGCGKKAVGREHAWIGPWQWDEKDKGTEEDEQFFFIHILKERKPWLTPTESCASDETEEEEVRPLRAPPGLSDPFAEEAWPFDGFVPEQVGHGLSDQIRLSILSWNAGLLRRKETNSVVGSYLVIPLQESYFHEVTESAAEQFHT